MAVAEREHAAVEVVDLATTSLRDLNRRLHELAETPGPSHWRIVNPSGAHAVACGLDADVEVEIDGHVGYYCAGMNKLATVRVHGNASQSAAATGRGGLVVVYGDASARCGISMKGVDIVVRGSVGHLSAFMAQTGRLVVCGDAGDALGDSLYEAVIYIRGQVKSLGADAREEPMTGTDHDAVKNLLAKAGLKHDPGEFRRVASKRELYHWNADANQEY